MKEMKHDYVKHVKAKNTEDYYDVTFIIKSDLDQVTIVHGYKATIIKEDHKHWEIVSEDEFRWIKEDIQEDGRMLRNLLYIIENNL